MNTPMSDSKTRWYALVVLCLGTLMIVLDTTIVNVALPSIRTSLGFSQTSLAWVVNAYILTFGGLLLLGGRLGDLYGHRRLFLLGIGLFTVSSLACGLSTSQDMLVGARAVQGIGGAVTSAVSLSLTMTLFTEPAEQEEAAEGEHVGVHDPRQGGLGEAEIRPDRGERHIHDRRIEHDHQGRQAEDDQCEPACSGVGHGVVHIGWTGSRGETHRGPGRTF
jgi:hypothetical protein